MSWSAYRPAGACSSRTQSVPWGDGSARDVVAWALGTIPPSLESSPNFPRAAWLQQREGDVRTQPETLRPMKA